MKKYYRQAMIVYIFLFIRFYFSLTGNFALNHSDREHLSSYTFVYPPPGDGEELVQNFTAKIDFLGKNPDQKFYINTPDIWT